MEAILSEWQLKYYSAVDFLYALLLSYYPRFDNYNQFEKFIILNLVVIATYIVCSWVASISPRRIKTAIIRLVFSLGPVKKEVAKNLEKARTEILAEYPADLLPKLDKVPYKAPDVNLGDASEKEALKGKLSGSRYAL